MSVNVPPPVGMSPTEIAKELRVLLRNLYKGATSAPPPPQVAQAAQVQAKADEVSAQQFENAAASEVQAATDKRYEVDDQLGLIIKAITEIEEISKLRKPSEIRKRTKALREVMIPELSHRMYYEREKRGIAYSQMTRATKRLRRAISYLQQPQAASQPSPIGSFAADITRAYSLVQGLPATEGAPSTKEESTLRAITAILKAHHGVDPLDGNFVDGVPPPDAPLILMHYMEKPVPVEPTNGNGKNIIQPIGPFRISGGGSADWQKAGYVTQDPFLDHPWNNGYGNEVDVNRLLELYADRYDLTSAWNGGDCTLETALDVLRLMRTKYSTSPIALYDALGNVVCEVKKNEQVEVPVIADAADPGFSPRFSITGASSEWSHLALSMAVDNFQKKGNVFGSSDEVVPDPFTIMTRWNNGECGLDEALDMLRICRMSYKSSVIKLKDGNKRLVAATKRGEKVEVIVNASAASTVPAVL